MYVCMYIYIYIRLDLRNKKVIRHFCEMATHFGEGVCTCESSFAMYFHF